jgi:hypothetical protein
VSDLGSVHEAARDALSRGAWEEALVLARGGGDEPDLLDVEAEASWWLGRLDACITAREAAFQLFEARGDRCAAGRVAVRLWEHHMIKVRPAIASAWLRRARRALEDEQDSEAFGNLVLREAELAHGSGDLTGAAQRAREVHALGRRLGSVDLEAEALQTLGRVLIDAGEVAEGLGSLDEAMLSAVEGRLSPYSTGKVLCSMISACEQLGDLRRAAEWTDATLRWSADHPLAMWPGICRVHHAALLQQRGDLVGAEREARRACQDLDGFHVPNVAAGWVEVGEVRRRLGTSTPRRTPSATRKRSQGSSPLGWPWCGSRAAASRRRVLSSRASSTSRRGTSWRAGACCLHACRSLSPSVTPKRRRRRPRSWSASPASTTAHC